MRRVALLTLLAFGCATARPPPPGVWQLATPPARVALAEPELELWMEGTRAIDPQEESRTLEASRVALEQALSGRGLEARDPDQLLVVRARAIKVTEERKRAQTWSIVGIVFVVLAVVVLVVVLSRSHSSSGGGRGGHAALPAGGPGGGPRPVYFAPRPYAPPPPIGVFVGFNVMVPVGPPPPIPYLQPTEAHLASRGWFDGDEVELTAELVDPTTGAVSWHQSVREGIDPRDPAALGGLVDRALWGLPFGQRGASAEPAQQ